MPIVYNLVLTEKCLIRTKGVHITLLFVQCIKYMSIQFVYIHCTNKKNVICTLN